MKTQISQVKAGRNFLRVITISDKERGRVIGFRAVERMVQVAVAYCAPDDKYKGKIGRKLVQDRIAEGYTSGKRHGVISLPLGDLSDSDIASVLSNMFNVAD